MDALLPVPPIPFAGPILVGIVLCYTLYGFFLVQVVQYAQTVAQGDRPWIRALVLVVGLFQLLNLIFCTHNAWHVLVLGYLEPMNLIAPPSTAPITPLLNGLVTLGVQGYFCWKIYSLSQKNKVVIAAAAMIGVVSLVQLGASVAILQKFAAINRDATRLQELKASVTVHLVSTAICDVLITLSMSGLLLFYKANTSFAHTKSLLNKLVVNTVENGLITTVTAIANLVVYLVRTQDLVNVAFQYIIGGLYIIVLITNLNRRQASSTRSGTSISLSDMNGMGGHRIHQPAVSIGGSAAPFQVKALRTVREGDEEEKAQPVTVSVSSEHHQDASSAKAY